MAYWDPFEFVRPRRHPRVRLIDGREAAEDRSSVHISLDAPERGADFDFLFHHVSVWPQVRPPLFVAAACGSLSLPLSLVPRFSTSPEVVVFPTPAKWQLEQALTLPCEAGVLVFMLLSKISSPDTTCVTTYLVIVGSDAESVPLCVRLGTQKIAGVAVGMAPVLLHLPSPPTGTCSRDSVPHPKARSGGGEGLPASPAVAIFTQCGCEVSPSTLPPMAPAYCVSVLWPLSQTIETSPCVRCNVSPPPLSSAMGASLKQGGPSGVSSFVAEVAAAGSAAAAGACGSGVACIHIELGDRVVASGSSSVTPQVGSFGDGERGEGEDAGEGEVRSARVACERFDPPLRRCVDALGGLEIALTLSVGARVPAVEPHRVVDEGGGGVQRLSRVGAGGGGASPPPARVGGGVDTDAASLIAGVSPPVAAASVRWVADAFATLQGHPVRTGVDAQPSVFSLGSSSSPPADPSRRRCAGVPFCGSAPAPSSSEVTVYLDGGLPQGTVTTGTVTSFLSSGYQRPEAKRRGAQDRSSAVSVPDAVAALVVDAHRSPRSHCVATVRDVVGVFVERVTPALSSKGATVPSPPLPSTLSSFALRRCTRGPFHFLPAPFGAIPPAVRPASLYFSFSPWSAVGGAELAERLCEASTLTFPHPPEVSSGHRTSPAVSLPPAAPSGPNRPSPSQPQPPPPSMRHAGGDGVPTSAPSCGGAPAPPPPPPLTFSALIKARQRSCTSVAAPLRPWSALVVPHPPTSWLSSLATAAAAASWLDEGAGGDGDGVVRVPPPSSAGRQVDGETVGRGAASTDVRAGAQESMAGISTRAKPRAAAALSKAKGVVGGASLLPPSISRMEICDASELLRVMALLPLSLPLDGGDNAEDAFGAGSRAGSREGHAAFTQYVLASTRSAEELGLRVAAWRTVWRPSLSAKGDAKAPSPSTSVSYVNSLRPLVGVGGATAPLSLRVSTPFLTPALPIFSHDAAAVTTVVSAMTGFGGTAAHSEHRRALRLTRHVDDSANGHAALLGLIDNPDERAAAAAVVNFFSALGELPRAKRLPAGVGEVLRCAWNDLALSTSAVVPAVGAERGVGGGDLHVGPRDGTDPQWGEQYRLMEAAAEAAAALGWLACRLSTALV